jgi:hypothetical protein
LFILATTNLYVSGQFAEINNSRNHRHFNGRGNNLRRSANDKTTVDFDIKLGALVILVSKPWHQERPGRLCHFNKSMTALEEYWLPKHRQYPLYLLTDEQRWAYEDRVAIRRQWRSFDIHFLSIQKYLHNPPTDIAFEDAKAPLSNIEYKNMIAFFTYGFTRVPELTQYHYLMRLDDDSCMHDTINYDMFAEMRGLRTHYAFRAMFLDKENVVEGMNEFIDEYRRKFLGRTDTLDSKGASDASYPWANLELHNWRVALNTKGAPSFSTNFEIIDIRRYLETDIAHFLRHVENSHMIYHRRWGDAPIRYYMAELFWGPQEVLWMCDFDFQHSSWPPYKMCERRISNNSVIAHFQNFE